MKTYLDCIPCFFKQALEASRLSGANDKFQKMILDEVSAAIPGFRLSSSPPEMAKVIHDIIRLRTGVIDPYKAVKDKSNSLALGAYPKLKLKVSRSKDRLLTAIELAISGNIIDYGVKNSINVEKELDKILKRDELLVKREGAKKFSYEKFCAHLRRSRSILYLGDNAGEVVFDRILIEEIRRAHPKASIAYVVKESPIINDALKEDAEKAGIGRHAEIISSGVNAPGTILKLCSKNFLKRFKSADMVISKGQGNFEALSSCGRGIFFLFMAKCPVVAKEINCVVGDIILTHNKPSSGCNK